MMQRHAFTRRCMVRNCAVLKRSGCSACNLVISALPVTSGWACNQTSTLPQTPSMGSLRVRQCRGHRTRAAWVGRPDFALAPQPGQFGEETFKAFARWRFLHVWRGRCHQGRLGFPDGMQQQQRIQPGSVLAERVLHVTVDCIVLYRAVAGRGGLTVMLDGGGAVPGLVDQLERGLEEFTYSRNAP